ncbi:PilZ domain-containing protein [Catenovulum sp. 2E275]|uniref:PilZ domain-containing protein n=1 Tax=Catenovulum sp. 2E275 TaxID=2980497 RepID=UPI0021D3A6F5|nr:PilZ domain-containing protein [Catenovulum sp. 2E275]MCU4674929.1 PilZ domain-containing protein [Catenovulum sp. 2E275]
MNERRHFTRFFFAKQAVLSHDHDDWYVDLIDLSLNGALVSYPENALPSQLNHQDTFKLSFSLTDNADIEISMTVNIVHIEPSVLGLQCQQMDIESATHLRRIVELNLADQTLLQRELQHLIEDRQI